MREFDEKGQEKEGRAMAGRSRVRSHASRAFGRMLAESIDP